MNSVAPGPVFTPVLGDFVDLLGAERFARDAALMKRPPSATRSRRSSRSSARTPPAGWWAPNVPGDGGLASLAMMASVAI
jgi:hypothetical protein